jgi:hypothetical protein
MKQRTDPRTTRSRMRGDARGSKPGSLFLCREATFPDFFLTQNTDPGPGSAPLVRGGAVGQLTVPGDQGARDGEAEI